MCYAAGSAGWFSLDMLDWSSSSTVFYERPQKPASDRFDATKPLGAWPRDERDSHATAKSRAPMELSRVNQHPAIISDIPTNLQAYPHLLRNCKPWRQGSQHKGASIQSSGTYLLLWSDEGTIPTNNELLYVTVISTCNFDQPNHGSFPSHHRHAFAFKFWHDFSSYLPVP